VYVYTILYTYSHREGEREWMRVNQREKIEGQQFTHKAGMKIPT
jgi:hypothetical protein